jgi:polar amino acid transport system permease protein
VTQNIFDYVLPGALVTLEIAAGGWLVSAVVGFVLALVTDTGLRVLQVPTATFVVVARSIPQLVIVFLVYYGPDGFGISVSSLLAAIVGLGLADSVFMAEYYRAGLLTVKVSQREAAASLGLTRLQVMRLVVVPQALPVVVPPLLNSFVGLTKSATIASFVGAPELLYNGELYLQVTGQILPVMLPIIGLYLAATVPLSVLVGRLERKARANAIV